MKVAVFDAGFDLPNIILLLQHIYIVINELKDFVNKSSGIIYRKYRKYRKNCLNLLGLVLLLEGVDSTVICTRVTIYY